MARPRIKIDWEQFDKLCHMQATRIEIAQWFNCTDETIDNACKREKKVSFSSYYDQKRGRGRISLRRKMYEMALSGDRVMCIWLSKQYLGMTDKQEIKNNATEGFEFSSS